MSQPSRAKLFVDMLKNRGYVTVPLPCQPVSTLYITMKSFEVGHKGDIMYNYGRQDMLVRSGDCWVSVDMTLVNSEKGLRHPENPGRRLAIFDCGLPVWVSEDTRTPHDRCWDSIGMILGHFGRSEMVTGLLGSQPSERSSDRPAEQPSERYSDRLSEPSERYSDRPSEPPSEPLFLRPNQQRLKRKRSSGEEAEGSGSTIKSKSSRLDGNFNLPSNELRFIHASRGFPSNAQQVHWPAGFATYLPFVGWKAKWDVETTSVLDMASRPCISKDTETSSGPGPSRSPSLPHQLPPKANTCDVEDMVDVIELDEKLKHPRRFPPSEVYECMDRLVRRIEENLGAFKAVVVRGWQRDIPFEFSKLGFHLLFGDLGQRVQWLEGFHFAANRFASNRAEMVPVHVVGTLQELLDNVDDPNTCSNWLDSKHLVQSPPSFISPLLDSTTAWNHTFHVRFTQKTKQSGFNASEEPPTVVRAANWSAPGWRLVSHGGAFTGTHNDCCGLCTYVVIEAGCKLWAIMRPKTDGEVSPEEQMKRYREMRSPQEGVGYDCDMVTICLEDNDVLIQPPALCHMVYTPVPSVVTGGYFFNYQTMHLTKLVRSMPGADSLTNDKRGGSFRTLCRMLIALRYRSGGRKMRKRSLLSLIMMILTDYIHGEKDGVEKAPTAVVVEEAGDLEYAKKCGKAMLDWLKMTPKSAKEYLSNVTDLFSAGEDIVEIPAIFHVPDFSDLPDIFPAIQSGPNKKAKP